MLASFFDWIHIFDFSFLYFLKSFRSPTLNQIFVFLNFFDTLHFFLLLIVFFWAAINPKTGVKIFALTFLSRFTNLFLKKLFFVYRPFVDDPSLALITVPGLSFPSGAAQTSILLPGLLIASYPKKVWAWVLGIVFGFFLSLSRIYLGVHFPSDVVGGWIVGGAILFLFFRFSPMIETWFLEKPSAFRLFFLLFLSSTLSRTSPSLYIPCASLVGVALGTFFYEKCSLSLPSSLKERFYSLLFAFSGIYVFLLAFGLTPLGIFFVGLWLSFGGFYLLNTIFLQKEKLFS